MSNKIDQNFIDDLIARTDIVSIIDKNVSLRKQGQNHVGNCPFHQENTASFSVNSQKQFYYCFGCKASGNAITFLMEIEKLTFVEALEKLASITGVSLPGKYTPRDDTNKIYSINNDASKYYLACLRQAQHHAAITYLKDRGISGKTAKNFLVGYAPAGWNNLVNHLSSSYSKQDLVTAGIIIQKDEHKYYDRFRERIIFPIRNHRGQLVGFGGRTLGDDSPKYLNSPETPVFHKSKTLFGLFESINSQQPIKEIVVVEGYLDVMQMHQHGLPYAVATLGTAVSKEHIQLLTRYTKRIVFCFDGDQAGFSAAKKALFISLGMLVDQLEVHFVFLPENTDPDSILSEQGQQDMLDILKQAIAIDDYFFQVMSTNLNLTENQHKAKLITACKQFLDKMPLGAMQRLMYSRLSSMVHLPVSELQTLGAANLAPTINKQPTLPNSLPAKLATLLMQNPTLAHDLAESKLASISAYPGSKLLLEIINTIQQDNISSTAALIERWRGRPHADILHRLIQQPHNLDTTAIKDEVAGLIDKMHNKTLERKIKELLSLSSKHGLSQEQKKLLANLIKQQKGL